jgi:predicted nucleic acid-binding protein
MMIAGASFLVAWLRGETSTPSEHLSRFTTLPAQYAEVYVHFLKRKVSPEAIAAALVPVALLAATEAELALAAKRYVNARRSKDCKASLADAILGAVAETRNSELLSIDEDFRHLNFRKLNGTVWVSRNI